nr:G protein-coupled receptor [Proales similis]
MNSSEHMQPLASSHHGNPFWLTVVFGVVCLIGSLANLTNVFVFLGPRLHQPNYKLLMFHSINNFSYLILCILSDLMPCAGDCMSLHPLNLIRFLIDNYFTSSMAIFNISMQIFLSLQRLSLITNRLRLRKFAVHQVLLMVTVISYIYYAPSLVVTIIDWKKQCDLTEENRAAHEPRRIEEDPVTKWIPVASTMFRLFLATVVLSLLNFFTLFKIRQNFNRKFKPKDIPQLEVKFELQETSDQFTLEQSRPSSRHKQTSDHVRLNRNITLSILLMSINSIVGTAPFAITYVLQYFLSESDGLRTARTLSLLSLYVMHGTHIVFFYFFNRLFRQALRAYLSRFLSSA